MSTHLFSLGRSQPPKGLIGWESFDSDGRYWRQMRTVAPCSLTPAGGRKPENKLVGCCLAVPEAALNLEPNAALYIGRCFVCSLASCECRLPRVLCLRLEEYGRGATRSFPSTKAAMFLRTRMLLLRVRIHLPLSLHNSDLFQCFH